MPSAASVKVEKQLTPESALVDSSSTPQNTPIKQGLVIIEHKIRNLEKRKVSFKCSFLVTARTYIFKMLRFAYDKFYRSSCLFLLLLYWALFHFL